MCGQGGYDSLASTTLSQSSWGIRAGILHQVVRAVNSRLVLVGVRIEQHISPSDLAIKPLPHRALIGAGAECEFMRTDGTTLCHGSVKAELVPKVGHHTSHGSSEIGYHLTGKLLDSLLYVFIDGICIETLHHSPRASKAAASENCAQISCRGARVTAERELSTSHSWEWLDTTSRIAAHGLDYRVVQVSLGSFTVGK